MNNPIRLVIAILMIMAAVWFMLKGDFALGAAFLALSSTLMGEGQKGMSLFQKGFQLSLLVAAVIVMGYTIFSDYVANS